MKKQSEQEPPEQDAPKRDLAKELEAFKTCVDVLRPFDKATQTRILHATCQFLDISIPRDNY